MAENSNLHDSGLKFWVIKFSCSICMSIWLIAFPCPTAHSQHNLQFCHLSVNCSVLHYLQGDFSKLWGEISIVSAVWFGETGGWKDDFWAMSCSPNHAPPSSGWASCDLLTREVGLKWMGDHVFLTKTEVGSMSLSCFPRGVLNKIISNRYCSTFGWN